MRAPTLDIDVVSRCNLNCASCCHFSRAAVSTFLSLEDHERSLEKLARIEGVATFFSAIDKIGYYHDEKGVEADIVVEL